jgi:hypothetical protein
VYSTQARGVDNGKDAWLVFFTEASGGSYSGCVVAVKPHDPPKLAAGCS